MNIDLTTPVSAISRVGKTTASRLKKLGIETVEDLIFYYPFRWQDFSQIFDIASLKPEQIVTVRGKIQLITNRRSFAKRKMLTEALVSDQTGSVKVIWFNQPFLTKVLAPGDEVFLSGKADFDRYTLQLVNPIYEKVSKDTTHTARLVPIYSLTSNLTQKQIRFLIKTVLPAVNLIQEWLPESLLKEFKLLGLHSALKQIHFPDDKKTLAKAINRLKFDELFLFQLQIILGKNEIASSQAIPIKFFEQKTRDFVSALPFQLTNDQKKVAWKIISDLQIPRPMNRLLEGDVGSGKTVVAALAMLNVALNQKQAVLMAPTEILASQHYKNICSLFEKTEIKIGLMTKSQKQIGQETVSKKKIIDDLSRGDINLVVGTHALIQDDIAFKDLVLAVIDEQHRFGVGQRKILRQKSGNCQDLPHLLSMTATPIPRSLALTFCGDLDLSIIREMPKERKKIITKVVDSKNRKLAYDFVREQVKLGRQIFVICPLIDPSDKLGVKSVTTEYEKLKKEIFPDLKIDMLHGKLKSADKEQIMQDFLAKKSDILVATSVVEVGVDVPNASVMLIEGSERFGLAQLHQFRGRVGRSSHQSYCFLFTDSQTQKTKERLEALVTAKDGFELAEFDLKFRGPGEIYGTIQSGFPEFKLAELTDYELVQKAKSAAEKILADDLNNYPLLKQKMNQFAKKIHLE
ncbi:MAG: ATP-dependent DNA helicase RecG [Candidatus Buchananbacteria bacterium]